MKMRLVAYHNMEKFYKVNNETYSWIIVRPDGYTTSIAYRLNKDGIAKVKASIKEFRDNEDVLIDCLCDIVCKSTTAQFN